MRIFWRFLFMGMAIFFFVSSTDPAWALGKLKWRKVFHKITGGDTISGRDIRYLRKLAKDTWRCIEAMVDENTQLPYDNIRRSEWTSVTNIGLYVASVVAAVDMGFISRGQARKRLKTLLVNLDQFVKWNGFTQSWNSVTVGRPAPHDPWISTLDSGNFYAGLMVGRAYFSELAPLFSRLIDAADWSKLYNSQTNKLIFGYNCKEKRFGGDLNDLGSDARLAYFLAIAMDKIPVTAWGSLNRDMEMRYGLQYLQPGWQGGGLFMQMISGLILDERDTFLGQSAANFAFAQIRHARENQYPVWGWSACEAPDGSYLGMNALKDEIVTPHASVLAIAYYPKQVIANLKKLEALGARKPYLQDGKLRKFGFRDSINFETKAVANNYLILDQCMLFLALANFLDDNIILKTFKQDPHVEKAYQQIPDLQPRGILNTLRKRDIDQKYTEDDLGIMLEPDSRLRHYTEKTMQTAMAVYTPKEVILDGRLSEWHSAQPIHMDRTKYVEIERMQTSGNQEATVYFMWDENYLYFAAEVQDDELVFTRVQADIWKDDVIELFIAPKQNDFVWGQQDCFQIGLAASGPQGHPQTWAWFQNGSPGDNVKLAARSGANLVAGKSGYILEAKIKWMFIGVTPQPGTVIGVSPAIHFVDSSRKNELKLNWCFLPDGKSLGRLTLKK